MKSRFKSYQSTFCYAVLIMMLGATMFSSCLEEPKIKLLQSDNEYIDSIFSNSIDSLRTVLDSLCIKERDKIFLTLIDSITEQRLEDIETIVNRK